MACRLKYETEDKRIGSQNYNDDHIINTLNAKLAELKNITREKDKEIENITREKDKEIEKLYRDQKNMINCHAALVNKSTKRIHNLEQTIKTQKDQHKKKTKESSKQLRKLKNELKKFDNSNTPPSCRASNKDVQDQKRRYSNSSSNNKSKTTKKKGGQKGHKGVTNKPEPNRRERRTLTKCPNCKGRHLTVTGSHKRLLTKIMKQAEYETILYDILDYECNSCHNHVCDNKGLPKKGEYRINVQSQVLLAFLNRLPYRLIARDLTRIGINISFATVYAILKNIGTSLELPTQDILDEIRKSPIIHIDETSISLNGKKVWIWVFLNPTSTTMFYVIRNSRGADVLNEVLPDWKGTVVCDGWKPYSMFVVQRCWAHILREAENIHAKFGTKATTHTC